MSFDLLMGVEDLGLGRATLYFYFVVCVRVGERAGFFLRPEFFFTKVSFFFF